MEKSLINLLYKGTTTIQDFQWDNMTATPILSLINSTEIEYIRKLITSPRYSGNNKYKMDKINELMKFRGFTHFAGGTNRLVYTHPAAPNAVFKVAIDAVGIKDNPAEYYNQQFLKPYCCKVFECSPCGTIASFEKVERITTFEEFYTIADDYFYILSRVILGKYVMDDIGIDYFMNIGIRKGCHPVILDFPYLFELDGRKLECGNILDDGSICGGDIDYDPGFNNLICKKCGRVYKARDLALPPKESSILLRNNGGTKMQITVKRGNTIIKQINTDAETDFVSKHDSEIGKSGITVIKANRPNKISKDDTKKFEKENIVPAKNNEKVNNNSRCKVIDLSGEEDTKDENDTFESKIVVIKKNRGSEPKCVDESDNTHEENESTPKDDHPNVEAPKEQSVDTDHKEASKPNEENVNKESTSDEVENKDDKKANEDTKENDTFANIIMTSDPTGNSSDAHPMINAISFFDDNGNVIDEEKSSTEIEDSEVEDNVDDQNTDNESDEQVEEDGESSEEESNDDIKIEFIDELPEFKDAKPNTYYFMPLDDNVDIDAYKDVKDPRMISEELFAIWILYNDTFTRITYNKDTDEYEEYDGIHKYPNTMNNKSDDEDEIEAIKSSERKIDIDNM